MTDAPKKRPIFQLHLSSCVLLMFVAGGLVWMDAWVYRNFPGGSFWLVFVELSILQVTVLIGAAQGFEYLLRRRERRRHD